MTKATTTLACLLLAFLAIAGAANASTRQMAIFQDDKQLITRGPAIRDEKLDEIKALGVDVVKFYVTWTEIAPNGPVKPAGYNGADLRSYDEARWEAYDGLVRAATARGLKVLVAPTTPAPGWATGPKDDAAGVERPNPVEFGKWIQAVGQRYDGKHRDPQGNPIPKVSFWSIGNEPNHPLWLQPLGSASSKRAVSPHIYRNLVRQAVLAFGRSGHKQDTILFGELLPIGSSALRRAEQRPAGRVPARVLLPQRGFEAVRGEERERARVCELPPDQRSPRARDAPIHARERPPRQGTDERRRDDPRALAAHAGTRCRGCAEAPVALEAAGVCDRIRLPDEPA